MSPLRRALSVLRSERGRVLGGVALWFATIAAGIGLMGTSAWLVSTAALHPSIAALQVAIVGVRAFGLSRGVFRYLERLVSHDLTFRLLARLRVDVFRALVPLAPARFVAERTGDLMARLIGDVDTLEHVFVRVISPVGGAVLTFVLVASVLGAFDGRVAMASAAGLAAAGVAGSWVAWRLGRKPGGAVVSLRSTLQASLVEGLRGMPDLVAFGRDGEWRSRVDRHSAALVESQACGANASSLGSAIVALGGDLSLVAVLAISIPLVRSGEMEGVHLAVVALITLAAFEAVAALPATAEGLAATRAAAARVFAAEGTVPPVPDPVDPRPVAAGNSLRVRGLRFTYPGASSPALDGLDLDLSPGSLVAIVGPSGSGKSTLAHLLLRFQPAPRDAITLDDVDVCDLRGDEVRARMAYLAQRAPVFTGTVRENLHLGSPQAADAEMEDVLRRVGLWDLVFGLPAQFDTWVGEQGARLSGGERQRLALARALLSPAPIVVLDEPVAHVDPVSAREILDLVSRLFADDLRQTGTPAVLLITHTPVGLERAREIVVLHEGRVVERGTFADLDRPGTWLTRMRELEGDWVGE